MSEVDCCYGNGRQVENEYAPRWTKRCEYLCEGCKYQKLRRENRHLKGSIAGRSTKK